MKLIGVVAFSVGVVLALIYVAAWIKLLSENEPAQAVRIAIHLWPGNAIGAIVLFLSILFTGGGLTLLGASRPKE